KLLVACGDAPELLESAEEALDEVAVFIEVTIIGTLSQTMTARRNHRLCASSFNGVDERIGIVALVSDDALRLNPLDEGRRFGHVGHLPGGQTQAQGIAQGFDRRMNFSAQPTPATSDGLIACFFGAPVACWWARTMVESTNNCSRSASFLS